MISHFDTSDVDDVLEIIPVLQRHHDGVWPYRAQRRLYAQPKHPLDAPLSKGVAVYKEDSVATNLDSRAVALHSSS